MIYNQPEIRDKHERLGKSVSNAAEHVAMFVYNDTDGLVKKQARLQKEHKCATIAEWQKLLAGCLWK